jgi:hypothetical protein
MPSDSDTGYVYTLTDPRTDEVRYVGATENPKRRLRSHVQNPHSEALTEWVDNLDADDAVPEMRVINVADIGELSDAEQSALDRLSGRFELLNKKRSSSYAAPSPRDRSRRRALLTDRERELIAGEGDDSQRYVAISRVRTKIEDELTDDLAILQENHPTLYEELCKVVCEGDGEDGSTGHGGGHDA